MAFACYIQVKEQLQQLISVSRSGQDGRWSTCEMFSKYKNLLETVTSANKLNKLLILQNNLFLVPFLSILIVLTIGETENWVQLAIKVGIFVPASVY